MLQTSKDIEECRFACTGCAAQKDHLAFGHVEIDSLENLQMVAPQIIGLAKTTGAEMDGVGHAMMRLQGG
jgi:hypothetical protein